MTFSTLLVADRGETAARVVRTAREAGLRTVAVCDDGSEPHARLADEAVRLGPAPGPGPRGAAGRVLRAARETGAGAVFPGRGPLAADADFARRCEDAGIVFVGPAPDHLEVFGDRLTARAAAEAAGLLPVPGTDALACLEEALDQAGRIGYPVVLKAAAGGSSPCRSAAELAGAWRRARRAGAAPGRVFLERLVSPARHVEVPVFGDGEGLVVTFADRDGSLGHGGRRLLVESPAPRLPDRVRAQLAAFARDLCSWVEYRSAGTVEFVYDTAREEAYFLEVDTRPRAEHAVTEVVHGVDLVAWTLRLARGEHGVVRAPGPARGHAVAACLEADARVGGRGAGPAASGPAGTGRPADSSDGVTTTSPHVVSPVQVIVHGADRDEALGRLAAALDATGPGPGAGPAAPELRAALADPAFRAAAHSTTALEPHGGAPRRTGGRAADHPTDE